MKRFFCLVLLDSNIVSLLHSRLLFHDHIVPQIIIHGPPAAGKRTMVSSYLYLISTGFAMFERVW